MATRDVSITEYPFNLGLHHRTITTAHPEAQVWFDRGLTWLYGFNLEEAGRCFEHALETDPTCPMACWGLAYASGPHYNFPWDTWNPQSRQLAAAKTHEWAQKALEAAKTVKETTPIEAAMIDAIQKRFPSATAPEDVKEFGEWNRHYADAMEGVYAKFSNDQDVAAFCADAMIQLTPWKLWDIETGEPLLNARTLQTKELLEKSLKLPRAAKHAGLLHIYIHLMEMSSTPELAVPAANQLRNLAPDCGHLQHMASHIDVLVGAFDLAVTSNADAVDVDKKYLARCPMGIYTIYALHNIASLIYAAMMAGSSEAALAGCDRMEAVLTEPFLRIPEPNMADYAEAFVAWRPHVLIRFGRWRDILALPLPSDPALYCATTGTLHYAKGIAHAALGELDAAEQEKARFHAAFDKIPETRLNFPNKSSDTLKIGKSMLDGELAYRRGSFEAAFASLTEAVALDDKLLYAEPPGWMVPARHAAAALLLEQGKVHRAAELYAEDLGIAFEGAKKLPRPRQHPNNMWALLGFHECLVKLGKKDEAAIMEQQLAKAKAGADVDVNVSCFCRLNGQAGAANGKGAAGGPNGLLGKQRI